MAEEKWTVFFRVQNGGNQVPLAGFTKAKVSIADGKGPKEKNKAWNIEAGLKTAEIQEAYFVTVVAESAEEACAVVDAIASGRGDPQAASQTNFGPRLGGLNSGKAGACLSANLTEVEVV